MTHAARIHQRPKVQEFQPRGGGRVNESPVTRGCKGPVGGPNELSSTKLGPRWGGLGRLSRGWRGIHLVEDPAREHAVDILESAFRPPEPPRPDNEETHVVSGVEARSPTPSHISELGPPLPASREVHAVHATSVGTPSSHQTSNSIQPSLTAAPAGPPHRQTLLIGVVLSSCDELAIIRIVICKRNPCMAHGLRP